MSLSTTQYGYIVDPMVPFTDDKGKTIKNGFIRVFMSGTSTPVITYRNYDGATNQEKIELDNSGRVKHNVIGSKGSLYKVVVYDVHHSQETPILSVDKIAVLGASINASGATIVTGLDSVTVQEENFLKATVEGTGVELALDPTEVTSDVNTISAAETAAPDYVLPLLDKTGTGDGKKISLANLFKFALDWISRLATTVTSFASGDFIAVSNTTNGARKMSKDTLLELTAQNALAGNVTQAFDPTRTSENPYKAGENVAYEGKTYAFKVDHYGAWADADVEDFVVANQVLANKNKSSKNAQMLLEDNLGSVMPYNLFGVTNKEISSYFKKVSAGTYPVYHSNGQISFSANASYDSWVFKLPYGYTGKITLRTQARFAVLTNEDGVCVGTSMAQILVIDCNVTNAVYLYIAQPATDSATMQDKASFGETLSQEFSLPDWMGINAVNQKLVEGTTAKEWYDKVPFYALNGFFGGNIFGTATKHTGTYVKSTGGKATLASSASYDTYVIEIPESYKETICYTAGVSRFNCITSADTTIIGSIGETGVSSYNLAGTTAKYLYISISSAYGNIDSFIVTMGSKPRNCVDIPYWLKKSLGETDKGLKTFSASVNANGTLSLPTCACESKGNVCVQFSCTIGSFTTLTVGLANNSSGFENGLVISSTDVTPYVNGVARTAESHGLTIQNNIQVSIVYRRDYADITIVSDGEMWSKSVSDQFLSSIVFGLAMRPYVKSGSACTDATLSWTSLDLYKDKMLFGDSYFSLDSSKWMYYLKGAGFMDNSYVNGIPGERSAASFDSLLNLVKFVKPKYVIWCLGMNDGSDSESAPSSLWVTTRNKLVDFCTDYGIELILATIPTVPTVNNEQKNAWIRSSGYRYIDFAKAVGASSSGVWYDGMLYTDGVHPTQKGAKALYMQALTDFPELMVGK